MTLGVVAGSLGMVGKGTLWPIGSVHGVSFTYLGSGSSEVFGSSDTVDIGSFTADPDMTYVVITSWARSSSGGISLGVSGLGATWENPMFWTDGVYAFRRVLRAFVAQDASSTGPIQIGGSVIGDDPHLQDMTWYLVGVSGTSSLKEAHWEATPSVLSHGSNTLTEVPKGGEGVLSALALEVGAGNDANLPQGLSRGLPAVSSANTRKLELATGVQSGGITDEISWSYQSACYRGCLSLVFSS